MGGEGGLESVKNSYVRFDVILFFLFQGDGLSSGSITKQTSSAGGVTNKVQHQQSVSAERTVESTDRGPPPAAAAVSSTTPSPSVVDDRSTKQQQQRFIPPTQIDVIPMEESDSDTETAAPLDTEGPFSNFAELKTRPAHLAVFLHYLISNSDPASLVSLKYLLLFEHSEFTRFFYFFSFFIW